jgi:hypothetical protein
MAQRTFISSDNKATFLCSECGIVKTVDVSTYKLIDMEVKIRVNCICGHKYHTTLEKRHCFRNETDIPGRYIYYYPDGKKQKGTLTIKNISRSGLKLKMNVAPEFKEGDKLAVEFRLDDKRKALIRKEVTVKRIVGLIIGVEFCLAHPFDPNDKAIGFYLL